MSLLLNQSAQNPTNNFWDKAGLPISGYLAYSAPLTSSNGVMDTFNGAITTTSATVNSYTFNATSAGKLIAVANGSVVNLMTTASKGSLSITDGTTTSTSAGTCVGYSAVNPPTLPITFGNAPFAHSLVVIFQKDVASGSATTLNLNVVASVATANFSYTGLSWTIYFYPS